MTFVLTVGQVGRAIGQRPDEVHTEPGAVNQVPKVDSIAAGDVVAVGQRVAERHDTGAGAAAPSRDCESRGVVVPVVEGAPARAEQTNLDNLCARCARGYRP